MAKTETNKVAEQNAATVAEVAEMLTKREAMMRDQLRYSWGADSTPLARRIENLFDKYEQIAVRNVASSEAFRGDVLTFVKAWAMIVDMAASATTHSEKNARLRGMLELLESAAKKLHEMKFTMDLDWWRYDNVFASDYPTLHYVRRIQELEGMNQRQEEQIKRLQDNEPQ